MTPNLLSLVFRLLVFATPVPDTFGAINNARIEFDKGILAEQAGDLEVALKHLRQAVAMEPTWALGNLELGIVEQQRQPESPNARLRLEQAVLLAPDNPRASYHLALSHEYIGNVNEAVKYLLETLRLKPDFRDAQFRLATVYEKIGLNDEAIHAYEQVLLYDPKHVGALTSLSVLYERREEYGKAEEALVLVTQMQPNVPYPIYRLGSFYERLGAHAKAKKVFNKLNKLDPRPKRRMRQLR